MHPLLWFVSRISVCTYSLQRIDCNQVISMFIIIIYVDGLAWGFVVELGGGLVHNTIIGYVNKLATLSFGKDVKSRSLLPGRHLELRKMLLWAR